MVDCNYNKNCYQNNKEKMKQQIKNTSSELINCTACNKQVKKGSMHAHQKTKLHEYIKSQQENNNIVI